MYSSGIEIPKIQFSLITYSQIEPGSYFIGFDLDNGGKLSKIDNTGTITVVEGVGGEGTNLIQVLKGELVTEDDIGKLMMSNISFTDIEDFTTYTQEVIVANPTEDVAAVKGQYRIRFDKTPPPRPYRNRINLDFSACPADGSYIILHSNYSLSDYTITFTDTPGALNVAIDGGTATPLQICNRLQTVLTDNLLGDDFEIHDNGMSGSSIDFDLVLNLTTESYYSGYSTSTGGTTNCTITEIRAYTAEDVFTFWESIRTICVGSDSAILSCSSWDTNGSQKIIISWQSIFKNPTYGSYGTGYFSSVKFFSTSADWENAILDAFALSDLLVDGGISAVFNIVSSAENGSYFDVVVETLTAPKINSNYGLNSSGSSVSNATYSFELELYVLTQPSPFQPAIIPNSILGILDSIDGDYALINVNFCMQAKLAPASEGSFGITPIDAALGGEFGFFFNSFLVGWKDGTVIDCIGLFLKYSDILDSTEEAIAYVLPYAALSAARGSFFMSKSIAQPEETVIFTREGNITTILGAFGQTQILGNLN